MSSKQIILARRDINMPPGKLAAQAAHASLQAILNCLSFEKENGCLKLTGTFNSEAEIHWLSESFTKVVLVVQDEAEMMQIMSRVPDWMPKSVIVDEGRTVFNGVHTVTCAAIGPASIEDINNLTGHLDLYS